MENNEKDPKKIAAEVMQKRKISNSIRNVQLARYIVFAVGGLQLIASLYAYFVNNASTVYLISGIVAMLLYVGLGLLSGNWPYLGLGLALGIYLAAIIYSQITNDTPMYKGALWKGIIVIGLINGLASVHKVPKKKRQSNSTLDDELIDS